MNAEEKITSMLSDFDDSKPITKEKLESLLVHLSEWQVKYTIAKLYELEIGDKDIEDVSNETQGHIYGLSGDCIKRFRESLKE